MKFSLIGVGKFGKNYIKTISQIANSSLTSVCSKTKEKFEALDQELKIAPWFDNYKEAILHNDCDSVIIATHPDSHFEITKFALENNKNVICEKPCLFSKEEFDTIENLIKSKNLIFYTDYINLFQPVIKDIKNFLNSKKEWHWMDIVNCGNGPIRENYSAIWDYGSHIFSVILHLFNKEDLAINSITLDSKGNYSMLVSIKNKRIYCTFGNKSEKRINAINFINSEESIKWEDDRKNQPLKTMIEAFIEKELESNIYLSKDISEILNTIK